MSERRRPESVAELSAAALAVVLAVFVCFRPALSAELVSFDDPDNLVHNPAWRGLGGEQLAWMWTASHMGHFHPLTWMSFGADWASSWGRDAAAPGGIDAGALHATNVALHALTAVAVLFLLRRMIELASDLPAGARLWGATAGALFFAVHPLRVESVAWVTERRDVLSGLGFVLAVLAWLRFAPRARAFGPSATRSAWFALVSAGVAVVLFELGVDLFGPRLEVEGLGGFALGAALALLVGSARAASRVANAERSARATWFLVALAALLSSLSAKAWGIVFPAVLLVLDVWPLARTSGHARPSLGGRLALLAAEKAPFLALTVVFGRLAAWAQSHAETAMLSLGQHGPLERLAQGLFGLAWYSWKTLWPSGLAPIHELPTSLSLAEPRFALAALGVLGVTSAAFALRRRAPALLAAWLAFAAVASPVLGVAQSGPQLVAERYTYLACLPFAALFGWGVVRLCAGRRWWLSAVPLVVLAPLGLATFRRTGDWRDSRALWEAAYAVHPDSPTTLLSLGSERIDRAAREQDPEARRALLEEALALLADGFARARNPRYLSNQARALGQLAELEPERAEEHRRAAVEHADRASVLALEQGLETARFDQNLGAALLSAGRAEQAVEPLARALERYPNEVLLLVDHGVALALSGRLDEGLAQLERAVALDPTSAEAWGKLGQARAQSGDQGGAIEAFRRVLELEPGHPAALARLRSLEAQ